jgi:phospholipase C
VKFIARNFKEEAQMRGILRSKHWRGIARMPAVAAVGAMLLSQAVAPLSYAQETNDNNTTTPIKHVILVIGENRTFDHLFGTYKPKGGQTISNLLSKKIVNVDGQPGKKAFLAQQYEADDTYPKLYSNSPARTQLFPTLPQPEVGNPTDNGTAPFATVADAMAVEPALLFPDYYLLTLGATGIPSGLDTRFPSNLSNDPFQITDYIPYVAYAGSPVHRFFQMWQELDCSVANSSASNPSGCAEDLFPWVEVTVATGSNGKPKPSGFIGEGAIAMGFYNNQDGDVPYFTALANQYSISDNYHQAINGGTGANHLAIGYGETIFFANSDGTPGTPPSNQIENPNPQPGTNNFYTQDGYGGGSYVNCADSSQPGVASIESYFATLPYTPWSADCQPNAYYLVNNYNPGYLGTGQVAYKGGPTDFTIPPSQQNNIGLELSSQNVSWSYYGEGWEGGTENGPNGSATYCNICNPFLYSKQIMTNAALRSNLKDIQDLYSDIKGGTLPAVSIVKPDGFLDGHPASSKWDLFEAFTKKIVKMVRQNPTLWSDTAIIITADEGGGYYDSGYVQPVDFFGDGTRIPLIVVSPYSTGGRVVHTYYDHVSFDKFVEANWNLPPISSTGRDNLPNPISTPENPYVPTNQPAIGNLMDMFQFPS